MKISVITISFNDRDGLLRTLEHVQCQLCHDYEYIVIDGASTDGSVELIEQYADIITYGISEKDNGPFDAMNKGIAKASGDYCIFMNSGDSFYDENVIGNFIGINPTADIYTGIAAEHIRGKIHNWSPPEDCDLSMRFFYRHAISHQASFIKTSLMKEMMYDTQYRIVADWKFFVEVLMIKNVSYCTLPFIVANYMDGGISRDEEKAFAEREIALERLFGVRAMRDFHSMQYGVNEWDTLAKNVDPKSRIGKLIMIMTKFMLKLRK